MRERRQRVLPVVFVTMLKRDCLHLNSKTVRTGLQITCKCLLNLMGFFFFFMFWKVEEVGKGKLHVRFSLSMPSLHNIQLKHVYRTELSFNCWGVIHVSFVVIAILHNRKCNFVCNIGVFFIIYCSFERAIFQPFTYFWICRLLYQFNELLQNDVLVIKISFTSANVKIRFK